MGVHLRENGPGPGVRRREDVREAVDVVSAASLPGDLAEVQAVVDPVVGERREPVLIDRVPEAELGRDSVVEPLEHRESVAAFRCGGQRQELDRPQLLQERRVGTGSGVVELVHDHDVEVVRLEAVEPSRVQALDGGEHVLELAGTAAAYPELAEGVVAQALPKRRQALGEDLLAMSHEQEAGSR